MVQRRFVGAILAGCTVVVIATTLPATTRKPAETCSFKFQVQDARDGSAVIGAIVAMSVVDNGKKPRFRGSFPAVVRMITDVDGLARFDGLALRQAYRSTTEMDGYKPTAIEIRCEQSGIVEPIIRLEAEPEHLLAM